MATAGATKSREGPVIGSIYLFQTLWACTQEGSVIIEVLMNAYNTQQTRASFFSGPLV